MVNRFKIDGKARTLGALEGRLECADVLPQVTFNVRQWYHYRNKCIREIEQEIGLLSLIVRSSAASEDTANESLAGHFESIISVSGEDCLSSAIDQVIDSLGECNLDKDEVLVQPMLQNIVRSGVALSVDPNTCAPYRVINYFEGNDAAAVTSGKNGLTYVEAARSVFCSPNNMQPIIKLINELEVCFLIYLWILNLLLRNSEKNQCCFKLDFWFY